MKKIILVIHLVISTATHAQEYLEYKDIKDIGGDTTVYFEGQTVQAYRNPARNLNSKNIEKHLEGDAFFERNFSDDPLRKDYGLGPVFNHASCIGCHNRDGRGALPMVNSSNEWKSIGASSVFLRISIENFLNINQQPSKENNWGAPIPVPGFSDQLFQLGSWGVRNDVPGVGQAKVWMKYEFSEVIYPDGNKVILRKPIFKITEAYSPRIFDSDVKLSPRIGTPMIGLGLLEAIPESDILKIANSNFSSEGVTGRPNWVFDIAEERKGNPYPVKLGRFGLKANTATVFHQSLGALRGDMGVTNYAFANESIQGTDLFLDFVKSFPEKIKEGYIEASNEVSNKLVFYSQTLAVPSRRNVFDPDVQEGARLFSETRCTTCHTPSFTTGSHEISELSNQKIYPFTDLLLHDMGDGLADGRKDFQASGREWKTKPLWGIGQSKVVNPMAGFLHDGRARTLEEAVLWHGGEAEYSVTQFKNLSQIDREKIIAFLNSL